ncbi:MAG: transposase [Nitriliruptorales bacterium]
MRDVYAADSHEQATDRLEAFLAWTGEADVEEVTRLARTIRQWRRKVLAYHTTHLSNGPTEAMNLLIKKVKRVGHGFRSFANYRLRLLLHCGVVWNTAPTAKIRGRTPSLVA